MPVNPDTQLILTLQLGMLCVRWRGCFKGRMTALGVNSFSILKYPTVMFQQVEASFICVWLALVWGLGIAKKLHIRHISAFMKIFPLLKN